MACKNLDEVVDKIMIELAFRVPLCKLRPRINGEIRDYFSHEVMKFQNNQRKGLNNGTVNEFFNQIFKEIEK